jgi:3-oxoacyl-[acyl-carrier protein] reductase
MDLSGKTALVTGSSRGIGRAIALRLARAGADVAINGSHASEALEATASEVRALGRKALAIAADVSSAEEVNRLVDGVVREWGRLDILVNNAGFTRDRMIYNVTDEEWHDIIRVNLFGTFYTTRAACRLMRQQRYGRIVNTSSHAGLGNMGQAAYSAAKEGIVGLTRTVGRDMARYGVTCNAIRPVSGTRGFRDMVEDGNLREAWTQMWGAELAERRLHQMLDLNQPEDVAALVVYLASEKADNVNACVFEVWHGHVGIYTEPITPREVLWKDGRWTPDELANTMPATLTKENVRELPPFFPF